MTEREHSLISPTAKLVAHMRAYTDIPYSQQIAQETCSEQAFHELVGEAAPIMVGFIPMIEHRYKAISDQLRKNDHNRILAMAEGLTPRSLEFTQDPSVSYVVTDLPGMLSETQPLLSKILSDTDHGIGQRPNLSFLPVNVLDIDQLRSAAALLPAGEIAMTSEGLVPYFPHQEKRIHARNIREILGSRGGAWYTTDMMTKDRLIAITQAHPTVQKAIEKIMDATASNLIDNAFVNDDEIRQLYSSEGLNAEKIDCDYLIPQMSSLSRLGIDSNRAIAMLKGRALWKFTPN